MQWIASGDLPPKWKGGQVITDEKEICEYFRVVMSEGSDEEITPEHLSDETVIGAIKEAFPSGVSSAQEAEDAEITVLIDALSALVIQPAS